jgi:hypothetical protein
LYDACKEEIEVGNRPLEIFTTTRWKNLVFKFVEKSGDKRKKIIEEQDRCFEKGLYIFLEFKNLATGLGWDEAKQNMDCSDEWWDEHLAVSGII